MSEATGCANCGRAIDGATQKFCPACGQPTPTHRIDWHYLVHEFEHTVLHMDRGILYSIKELMLRPGRLMRAYLEGRRANQVKPFLLLMITAAAVVFLSKILLGGDLIGSAMRDGYEIGSAGQAKEDFDPLRLLATIDLVKGWINAHFVAYALAMLPLQALVFRLAFKGRGLNYPEWLVVSAFLIAQSYVFVMVAILVQKWLPQAQVWGMLLASLYMIFSLVQLFEHHRRLTSTLRAIAGLLAFMVVQSVVSGAVAIAIYLAALRQG